MLANHQVFDFQEGMLWKLRKKIQGTELEKHIILHKCNEDKLGGSKAAFEKAVKIALKDGFSPVERPKVFLSKIVILKTSGTKGCILFIAIVTIHA